MRIWYFDDVLELVQSDAASFVFIYVSYSLFYTNEIANFSLELIQRNHLKIDVSLCKSDLWTQVTHFVNRVAFSVLFSCEYEVSHWVLERLVY